MKLSYVGGAARRGWVSPLLLLAALGQSPIAFAQDDDVEDDDAESESSSEGDEPSEPESTPATEGEEATAAPTATRKGNDEWYSPLRVLIGSRLINRSFRYTDALSDRDPTARAPVDYPRFTLPMPRAEARWYPAGHFTESWASQLGIVGGYEMAVGAKLSYDRDADGIAETPISETHDFWYVGARGRIPLGDIALGIQVDYGTHRVALSGDEAADPESLPIFPDVAYSQLEIGADFEWRIEQLIVGLHGSYNVLLGVGAIGEDVNPGADPTPWFPGTTGAAVDFGAYAGWRLSRVFDVLVGLDMRAYGLDFGSVTGDPANRVIAGGATDRFMSAWLALVVKLPAKPSAPVAGATGAAEGTDGKTEGGGAAADFDSWD